MEMGRRFLLVGLFVVWPFKQGTIMQVAMANLTAILFLALQLQVMPYRSLMDDYLALGCSLSLCVMLLCTVFYKVPPALNWGLHAAATRCCHCRCLPLLLMVSTSSLHDAVRQPRRPQRYPRPHVGRAARRL